jgi:hypothetical protein
LKDDGLKADEQQMYLKAHHSGREVLIAACDCELIGKRFAQGHLQLEVCADFFGAEKATDKDLEVALSKASIANLVGERSVGNAIRLGYVDSKNVLLIDGIPCAQMVLM